MCNKKIYEIKGMRDRMGGTKWVGYGRVDGWVSGRSRKTKKKKKLHSHTHIHKLIYIHIYMHTICLFILTRENAHTFYQCGIFTSAWSGVSLKSDRNCSVTLKSFSLSRSSVFVFVSASYTIKKS